MVPEMSDTRVADWREVLPASVRPYAERAPLGALLLGISSGFPFAMIGATLTTRLAEAGIEKKSVTAFALTLLLYNFKFLWAPAIDRVRLPGLADWLGQRRAWLLVIGLGVMAAVAWLGLADPQVSLGMVVAAALTVAFFGASYDIVIDAFRIESLTPEQLGVGSGMSQYGWRIGAAAAGGLALVVADRGGWGLAYLAATLFALPAIAAGWLLGEPARRRVVVAPLARGLGAAWRAVIDPLADFVRRDGAWLALAFILVHKLGDTVANLALRLLFADLGFSKDEIAAFDVGIGFFATIIGIFAGGVVYKALGMQKAVLLSLVLMAVSNLSFAGLAAVGHSNAVMAAAISFENFASGVGGVAIVAYLSALCDLRFTATQFALLSAAASVLGRFFSASTAGALIEWLGFVDFYLLTTVLALPGLGLFIYMMRAGLVDNALPPLPEETRESL
jgi:PAT family beta-lactamase induction signal transducer AmpG